MPGSPATTTILAIPRYANTDASDFAGQVNAVSDRIDAAIGSRLHDPGDLKWSARPAAPAGWLLCDGAAISRTTYATLFTAIGTAYGAGDGSTTFNVPDFRGRAPIGAGAGTGLTGRTRGAKLGTETISVADMPNHKHDLIDEVGQTLFVAHQAGGNGPVANAPASGYNGGSIGVGYAGGSAADGKMQPSTVTNVFIKT